MTIFWAMFYFVCGACCWKAVTNLIRGASDKAAAVLWCLRHEPGMKGMDLCAVTGISRSSIYIYLASLENQGLVRCERTEGPYPQQFRYYAVQP